MAFCKIGTCVAYELAIPCMQPLAKVKENAESMI